MEKVHRPKFCATFVIFKALPKVNSRTIGENLPNLVTLFNGLLVIINRPFKNAFLLLRKQLLRPHTIPSNWALGGDLGGQQM
jgi:hypothetical protein